MQEPQPSSPLLEERPTKLTPALGKVAVGRFTFSRGMMVTHWSSRRLIRGIDHDALVRLVCGSLWFPTGVQADMSSFRVAPHVVAAARAWWHGGERQGGPAGPSGWCEMTGSTPPAVVTFSKALQRCCSLPPDQSFWGKPHI